MKFFSSIVILLMLGITGSAQPLDRRIADSLLKVLPTEKSPIERIKMLNRLTQFYILKTGESQIDYDSATRYLNEAHQLNQSLKSVSLEAQLLITESFIPKENGRKNEARQKVEEAIKLFESGNDKHNLGTAYSDLSRYYDFNDSKQLAERIRLMEIALSYFQQTNDAEEIGASYHALGDLYQIKDDFSKSLKYLGLALETYKSINHAAVQGIYSLMGKIYGSEGDFKQALNYGLLALKNAEDVGDKSMQLCQINNAIGRTLVQLNERRKAIDYFNKALAVAEKYNDCRSIYLVSANLASNLSDLGYANRALQILKSSSSKCEKTDDIEIDLAMWRCYIATYTRLKQYANAQPYCDRLLQVFNSENVGEAVRIDAVYIVADFYISFGKYDSAVHYLDKHRELCQKSSNRSNLANNYKLWFELDTSRHNYSQAVNNILNYDRIMDSVFTETKVKQLQQLEVQYETTKKEDSLKQQAQHISLLQQRNNLQQANLKQADLIKNITIAGTAAALIVLSLLYYQFKRNKKSGKIILQKNDELEHMLAEKEWWLKEVHHRVKNNLHTIICLLESQAMYLEKDALLAVETSQHRIYAMSLIHQKLYQNDDTKSINMSVYLDEFLKYLKESFDTEKIEFISKVESIHLTLQQAIPIALIINEAVTNSIKYAFNETPAPKIFVSMYESEGLVHLIITDNGQGFVLNDEIEAKSLGIQLIKGLSKEIRGVLSIEGKNGAEVTIHFKKDTVSLEQIMSKELASYEI
jgi:two-component sensor histidine kinase